ncbi:MAG: type II secretion system GspH family protein [Candidatus Omnitrophica bacterium]|nr:type II secretion system GspH family protein [Candidatus Omnitrophota bacterium]
MRIYQVQKFSYGYTFIELLVVITIIGIFFYLAFPTVKDIIPPEENKKITPFVDIIEEISRKAIVQKQKFSLTIDIDSNSYAVIGEKDIGDTDNEQGLLFTELPFIFIRAQNSSIETSTGLITFLFFPDGSKEFGLIFVKDMDKEDIYTIFLNPYTISPEVIKGEAKLEED